MLQTRELSSLGVSQSCGHRQKRDVVTSGERAQRGMTVRFV
jgi:hypothetical protein